ncbi:TrkH family potassium uptake protein [Stackebrandtia soli]|uniref:TrkH family potassium uptake protein n=1 Tax=Stackebrandtia soli TaxID=1892856 RepID=UPI0039E80933
MRHSITHPVRLVPLAFLIAALIGTGLLMLPISRAGDGAAPPLVALFTAVSAVCVTGLVIVDTVSYWSTFGEVVLVVLIQIGGFGIMTLASMLGLLAMGKLGLRHRLTAQLETKTLGLGDVGAVLKRVAILTFVVEATVGSIMTLRFLLYYGYDFGDALWHGLFHAVSAFNNAGFALYSDSVEGFVTDPLIMLPLAFAVIIGGIGFPVLLEVGRRMWRPVGWSVHTKLTLAGTAILLVLGFIAYLWLEWSNAGTIGNLSTGEKILASFFNAVMPRTAGFNAVPVGELNTQTLAVTDILMFIGGGSAGTAGGIKVTTFFLLAFVIWAEVRGEEDVTVGGRRIDTSVQRQALSVALLGVAAVAVGTLILLINTEIPLDDLVFEAISAFATVGLSTGITPELPLIGHLTLIVLMFAGRVGTFTVAAALAMRSRRRYYRYPTERPIVG